MDVSGTLRELREYHRKLMESAEDLELQLKSVLEAKSEVETAIRAYEKLCTGSSARKGGPPNSKTSSLISLLKDHGPLPLARIAELAGQEKPAISGLLNYIRKTGRIRYDKTNGWSIA